MELEELAAWIDWELLGDHEDSTTASSGDSSSEEDESGDSFYTCDEFSSDGEASVASEDLGRCLIVGRWTSNSVARYCRASLDRWEGLAWVHVAGAPFANRVPSLGRSFGGEDTVRDRRLPSLC